MEIEEKYMQRCLQLAKSGEGQVSPNPLVGCVVVHNGKIIGEGYHREYGYPHAEVNAINSVKDQSLLRDATLYVNLEPCSHYGKTPPCSALIIEKKIPRVVVGQLDPYPEVSGRGIKLLKDAGVEVECDFLKEACEELNKRFLTYYKKGRPYIILKWAQSADNFMDRIRVLGDGTPAVRFSDSFTQMMVHKLRASEDAIMVGTHTALLDNPSLNVRNWSGKNPLRIALDKRGLIQSDSHLLNDNIPTLIFTDKQRREERPEYAGIDFQQEILPQIMKELYSRKIQSLIVEGGAILLESFIKSRLWDEAHVETACFYLEKGISIPPLNGKLINMQKCKNSILSVYKNVVLH